MYTDKINSIAEIEKTDAILKSGELWANIVYPPSALV